MPQRHSWQRDQKQKFPAHLQAFQCPQVRHFEFPSQCLRYKCDEGLLDQQVLPVKWLAHAVAVSQQAQNAALYLFSSFASRLINHPNADDQSTDDK